LVALTHLKLAGPNDDALVGPTAGEPLPVLGIVDTVHSILPGREEIQHSVQKSTVSFFLFISDARQKYFNNSYFLGYSVIPVPVSAV
jgi:hypothetical protein